VLNRFTGLRCIEVCTNRECTSRWMPGEELRTGPSALLACHHRWLNDVFVAPLALAVRAESSARVGVCRPHAQVATAIETRSKPPKPRTLGDSVEWSRFTAGLTSHLLNLFIKFRSAMHY
jgi:hypothetical protein